MKRAQIQLDEQTYGAMQRRAFEKGCSISSIVRELLAHSLGTGKAKQRPTIKDFTFIGAGLSHQARLLPLSERHDEALEKALKEDHCR